MRHPPTAEQQEVLEARDDIVVTGRPGSGKTTVALEKARNFLTQHEGTLATDQRVLFLSFSNAAVQRIRSAAQTSLPREIRRRLTITTFHAFCFDFLRSYGCFAGFRAPFQLLAPEDKALLKSLVPEEDMRAKKLRNLEVEEGRVRFGRFAELTAEILERVSPLRKAYAAAYPLIIADEYQDTSDHQHRLVQQLRCPGQLICLGDQEQRIYDWETALGSRADRLDRLVDEDRLRLIELAVNHRSAAAPDVYRVAKAVLEGQRRIPRPSSVKVRGYWNYTQLEKALKQEILSIESRIRKDRGPGRVSLAVMTYTNTFIASVSQMLRREGGGLRHSFYHQILIRPEDVGFAWRAIMECLATTTTEARTSALLRGAARLQRAKGSKSGLTSAERLEKWATQLDNGTLSRKATSAQTLRGKLATARDWTGDPVEDVERVSQAIASTPGKHLAPIMKVLEIRPPHDPASELVRRLTTSFARDGDYRKAPQNAEACLLAERLDIASEVGPARTLMTLHKCKGKEFDGVIVVNGKATDSVIVPGDEGPEFSRSRRLLHVGLTRARYRACLLTLNGEECPIWPEFVE